MQDRQLLSGLRSLGKVKAPGRVLEAILDELELGDSYASLNTELGLVFVAWNRVGISAVMKAATDHDFEALFRARFGRAPRRAAALPVDVGERFDLRSVTEFERAVLLKAREIPRGEVRTYSWIAAEIGHPAAVRGGGSALRKNPGPVLTPCQRAARTGGHIRGAARGAHAPQ